MLTGRLRFAGIQIGIGAGMSSCTVSRHGDSFFVMTVCVDGGSSTDWGSSCTASLPCDSLDSVKTVRELEALLGNPVPESNWCPCFLGVVGALDRVDVFDEGNPVPESNSILFTFRPEPCFSGVAVSLESVDVLAELGELVDEVSVVWL